MSSFIKFVRGLPEQETPIPPYRPELYSASDIRVLQQQQQLSSSVSLSTRSSSIPVTGGVGGRKQMLRMMSSSR